MPGGLTRRDGDDGVGDSLAKVGFRGLLHLAENHGGDLLRRELTRLALVRDLNSGLVVLLHNLERPVDLVALDLGVVDLAADEPLGVEDGVFGVRVVSVLCGVTDTVQSDQGEGEARGKRRLTGVRRL